jgi:molybdopterin/thiamine biosynthesis adenylyltransferase
VVAGLAEEDLAESLTPEPKKSALERKKAHAILQVEAFLSNRGISFEAIGALDLDKFKAKKVIRGWKTETTVSGTVFPILVLLDSSAPFSKPLIALADDAFFLRIPHVEPEGYLCLLEDHITYPIDRPDELLTHLFAQADELLTKGLSGENRIDFVNEFHDYWWRVAASEQKVGSTPQRGLSLVNPVSPSRMIFSCTYNGSPFFGESVNEIKNWIKNKSGKDLKDDEISGSFFLWLDSPLYPEQYPLRNMDIASLAKGVNEETYELLIGSLPREPGPLPILLSFSTLNGPALAMMRLNEPKSVSIGGKNRTTRFDGYRRDKMSDQVLASKYFTASKSDKGMVQRIDPEWIHSRGGNGSSASLLDKSVTLIGCGSLGSFIAILLAQAGVGKITIIDPEPLTYDNIGRHFLGAEDVGKSKAERTAERIRARLPHLDVFGINKKWEDLGVSSPEIEKANVILSTTGDWPSEAALNLAIRTSSRTPALVFGWTEAFACAGHALAVLDIGGCLTCGMDHLGQFQFAATTFPSDGHIQRLPACGQFFQPYGVLELGPAHQAIARIVLDLLLGKITRSEHRVWLGSAEYLLENGGEWKSWAFLDAALSEGKTTFNHPWLINKACSLCRS